MSEPPPLESPPLESPPLESFPESSSSVTNGFFVHGVPTFEIVMYEWLVLPSMSPPGSAYSAWTSRTMESEAPHVAILPRSRLYEMHAPPPGRMGALTFEVILSMPLHFPESPSIDLHLVMIFLT